MGKISEHATLKFPKLDIQHQDPLKGPQRDAEGEGVLGTGWGVRSWAREFEISPSAQTDP